MDTGAPKQLIIFDTIVGSKKPTLLSADLGEKEVGKSAKPAHDMKPIPGYSVCYNSYDIEKILEAIDSKQVAASELSFLPPRILQQELQSEHKTKWSDAYVKVKDDKVPRYANVIKSHVYEIKTTEKRSKLMKGKIVPRGNHDDEKDEIQKNFSNVALIVVSLLFSLVTFLSFRIQVLDA